MQFEGWKMDNMNCRLVAVALVLCASASLHAQQHQDPPNTTANPWINLMGRADAHAKQHHAQTPVLSPDDNTMLAAGPAGNVPLVPVSQLHAMGIRVIPWTTDEPEKMRAVIRTGVDGLITDRPDLLQQVLKEERASRPDDPQLKGFVVSAHRGGRGLRPENTLPSFENGLDLLSTELETDTGVSTDHVSLIWHDQFYNPQSCRKSDGSPYTLENRVYLRDISSADAQREFICDKLHFGPDQKNDLTLSPASVAFAKKEGLMNPYAPTFVEQLFRFVAFYVDYYTNGPGKDTPHASERAANARTVRFNLETKILPDYVPAAESAAAAKLPPDFFKNHTVGPQVFVDTLAGVIMKNHMENRCEIQSFDFRTLQLVEEQFPRIPTYYLTGSADTLSTPFVPESLR
jgi:glycerophosphoryl diester phosphodiesterase